jgi:hypothetical protein
MSGMKSRDAYMAFLASPLTARELGDWLLGPYRAAAPQPDSEFPPESGTVTRLRTVSHEKVAAVVEGAQREVCATIATLLDGDEEFIDVLVAAGAVSMIEGEDGPTYSAFDMSKLRLAERVLSLVAADYLQSPESFRARWSGLADGENSGTHVAKVHLVRRTA